MPDSRDTSLDMPAILGPPPPLEPPRIDTGNEPAGPPSLANFRQRRIVQQLSGLDQEEPPDDQESGIRFLLFAAIPGGLASMVIHLAILIILGIYMMATDASGGKTISLEAVEGEEEAIEEEMLDEFVLDLPTLEAPQEEELPAEEELLSEEPFEEADDLVTDDIGDLIDLVDSASGVIAAAEAMDGQVFVAHSGRGASLSARGLRRQHAMAYGATGESEAAVDLALAWIARHQQANGSWNFNHRDGKTECDPCRCKNPGLKHAPAKHGATALALLALLGAGHTHLEGEYRDSVAGGLRYLLQRQKNDGSFFEPDGRMYSHGLVTLALCEALAMTRYQDDAGAAGVDMDRLWESAQKAVYYVEEAQHAAGGWRYQPRQPGDTSVLGWQMMALKSAYLAGLNVNHDVPRRAVNFLDDVAKDGIGSVYTYQHENQQDYLPDNFAIGATTPIGLLCRIYTGWSRENPGLRVGVDRIGACTKSSEGMYFYYYATQVMHHYGGEPWLAWNAWMRDYLVKSQDRAGCQAGSWYFSGPHDDAGRLYCTAMAAMTLEVYYRYSPIYGTEVLRVPPKGSP